MEELDSLTIRIAKSPKEIALWEHLMSNYHYLGYQKMFGKRLQYIVWTGHQPLAAISFHSTIKNLMCRDRYIGWNQTQKQQFYHHMVNNNRFLVLPWIQTKNLASWTLAHAMQCVKTDWFNLTGSEPLLIETFVDTLKYTGTSYYAANFKNIGQTKGFKKDKQGFSYHGLVKDVFIYEVNKDFRNIIDCKQETSNIISLSRPARIIKKQEEMRMLMHQYEFAPNLLEKVGLTPEHVVEIPALLASYHEYFYPSYTHVNQRALGLTYLAGLMSPLERKSIEPIALAYLSGTDQRSGVRNLQRFMTESTWSLPIMKDIHQTREAAKLVHSNMSMINVDESDFLKKGKHSAGVARQYYGLTGTTDNCQAGVFMSVTDGTRCALMDTQLYIPKAWFEDDHEELRAKCEFPEGLAFENRGEIALNMIRNFSEQTNFDFQWVGCDSYFGTGKDFRKQIKGLGYKYFADITKVTQILIDIPEPQKKFYSNGTPRKPNMKAAVQSHSVSVETLVKADTSPWRRTILSEGAKGPIIALVKCLRVIEINEQGLPGDTVWLYVRKFLNGTLKFSFSNAPADTPVEVLDQASISRWTIEQCFEECKSELGLDHYEVRSYPAWHKHMQLVFLAHSFLYDLMDTYKKKQIPPPPATNPS